LNYRGRNPRTTTALLSPSFNIHITKFGGTFRTIQLLFFIYSK